MASTTKQSLNWEETESKDPLWKYVDAFRAAFEAAGAKTGSEWEKHPEPEELPPGVSIVRCTATKDENPITVAKVTQSIGIVIPPHRHHESHVLLRVEEGAIQVDCEGYSRRIEKGMECLIPKGFCHSVFAVSNDSKEDAMYLSAHYEKFLDLNNNRFLAEWPLDDSNEQPRTELDVVRQQMSWFLSLQPEYLDDKKHKQYRAWFYLLHFDEDYSLQKMDKTGHAGCWSHPDDMRRLAQIQTDQDKERKFRVGNDLSHKAWLPAKKYVPLFIANKDKAKASALTEYYAYYSLVQNEWEIVRPDGVQLPSDSPETPGFSKEGFLKYMKLLTEDFLPGSEYLIYMTPPQQPGMDGYVQDCQRRPFSSCVVGMTHGRPEFLSALFSFFLLCSSVLQQIRFAVRSDVNKIRHDETRRKSFFREAFLDALKPKS